MFTKEDYEQFRDHGIDEQQIMVQLDYFKRGFPYVELIRPATLNDGILQLPDNLIDKYSLDYDSTALVTDIVKFVPASGAASRMFKSLFKCLEYLKSSDSERKSEKELEDTLELFSSGIKEFAFCNDLQAAYGKEIAIGSDKQNLIRLLEALLTESGLNYGNKPKGLLKFHTYNNEIRTAVEEHFTEGGSYAVCRDGKVYLHLTVSPEHLSDFEKTVKEIQPAFEKRYGVDFMVSYSIQKPSTDTIAVDLMNVPFRLSDNKILFRPGGHGALIDNLNELNAEIIFVKNIDNVVHERLIDPTIKYKKAIAGVMLDYQHKIFNYLVNLDMDSSLIHDILIREILEFIRIDLCIEEPEELWNKSKEEIISYAKRKLNRPLRVCGMVKNEGEPGGGPFWVVNSDKTVSLQIIESSQVDDGDLQQKSIFSQSTHFNPVDIVCGVYNYKGEKFNLKNYIDQNTGFISQKSSDGRELKALELPGLWNGAMADWNTIFVEVPIATFNPVKTVFDLLREQHQPKKNS